MKVVMLAPANVIHTQRWVEGLRERGLDLVLATQHDPGAWRAPPGTRVVRLPHGGVLGYFRNASALRRLLIAERADLLNVHYASGYGTTAALAGFRPWMLSVWGSDVYDFPYESRLKGWWLRRNLRRADSIGSTSEVMARQVRALVPGLAAETVVVTPFGVDTHRFAPRRQPHEGTQEVVIGTVKKLEVKYGVDVLIRAFAQLCSRMGSFVSLRLELVGDGEQRAELERLAVELGVAERVRFVGAVAHAEVRRWLNRFDIYVAVSRPDSESFGVAVLEASACEVPVVVSDAGGLPEVVAEGETGIVVPREDVGALTDALEVLAANKPLRRQYGEAGRARVKARYEWRDSVDHMIECFAALHARHLAKQGRAR